MKKNIIACLNILLFRIQISIIYSNIIYVLEMKQEERWRRSRRKTETEEKGWKERWDEEDEDNKEDKGKNKKKGSNEKDEEKEGLG